MTLQRRLVQRLARRIKAFAIAAALSFADRAQRTSHDQDACKWDIAQRGSIIGTSIRF